jgi:hypothetical protein
MNKGRCCMCHTMQGINGSGQVEPHTNKYEHQQCKGSFKYPTDRTNHMEPLDYQENDEVVFEGGMFITIGAFTLIGFFVGVLLGYGLWGGS